MLLSSNSNHFSILLSARSALFLSKGLIATLTSTWLMFHHAFDREFLFIRRLAACFIVSLAPSCYFPVLSYFNTGITPYNSYNLGVLTQFDITSTALCLCSTSLHRRLAAYTRVSWRHAVTVSSFWRPAIIFQSLSVSRRTSLFTPQWNVICFSTIRPPFHLRFLLDHPLIVVWHLFLHLWDSLS